MANRRYVIRVALIVALGGFLMGFDASVISGVVKFIEPQFDLTKLQLGWAVSSLTLTATLAMMVSGPLSDLIGRKKVLSLAAVLYAISAVCSAIAPTFWFLVVARMIGGFGVGASLIIAPMYIAEISPPEMRGQMVSFNQLNIVIGISTAFFTNYLILQLGQSDAAWAQSLMFGPYNWRWMLGLETLPAIIYFGSLFAVPESPRWLVMKGNDTEGLAIMTRASGEVSARQELADIKAGMASDAQKERITVLSEIRRALADRSPRIVLGPLLIFWPLVARALRLVMVVGIVVAIIQQITGINSVFFYAPMIFEQSGIGTDASFAQAVLVGIINLVFTVVAILFVDRLGRKPLLGVGLAGIALSMFLLAYGFYSATYTLTPETVAELPAEVQVDALRSLEATTFEGDVAFKTAVRSALGEDLATQYESDLITAAIKMNPTLVLFGILGFVASFAFSIGPVMWVLFSELFPNRIRGIAISFVGLINSAVSFFVQLVFPWELANFGSALTFLIYGLFAAVGLVFIMIVLPETKGKSLEELETILVKNPS